MSVVGEAYILVLIEYRSIGFCDKRNGLYCRVDLGLVLYEGSHGTQPDREIIRLMKIDIQKGKDGTKVELQVFPMKFGGLEPHHTSIHALTLSCIYISRGSFQVPDWSSMHTQT